MARVRSPSVGQILRAAFEILAANRSAFGLYFAVFVPLTALGNWLDGGGLVESADLGLGAAYSNGLAGLLLLLPSAIGQYLLFGRVLGAHGLGPVGAVKFLGLALLSYLGVMGATLFLIVPGLLVGARWLLAPAFFTAGGLGVFSALAESWRTVRGSTVKVAAALLIILLAMVFVSSLLGALQSAGPPILGHIASALGSECLAVLLVALSAGAYTLLAAPRDELAEIFA